MLLNPGCMVDYIYHFQLTRFSAHDGFLSLWHQGKGQLFYPSASYKESWKRAKDPEMKVNVSAFV